MDEIELVTSVALFLLLASVCAIVFNRAKLPPLIGYLMAGIIISDFWTLNEAGTTVVETLSDIGLIVLMFSIGMEINLKKVRKQGMFAIEVAIIQLPLMVLGGMLGGMMMGFDFIQCLCLGGIISGSSTAVVMAVLKSQNRLDKEHIDMLVLITIMEDIGQVIILSIITPLLAGNELDAGGLAAMVISIMIFMLASLLLGIRFMPRIINWISDNVSPEILTITTVGLAFGMALLSSYVGLSVAIGAFLMGMMIASSRKSKDVAHEIEPMKDIFMAMFFISVGMEISLNSLVENIALIFCIYILFAVLKTSTVFLGYWIGNESPRNGFISAVGLVAMGEFAFIIAKQALDHHVVDDAFYTSVVGAALVSMVVLPFLTRSSAEIWDKGYERCPDWIFDRLKSVNGARDRFYQRMSELSRRNRMEVSSSVTRSYFMILFIVVVEVCYELFMPDLRTWGIAYFGGTPLIWNIIILILNMAVIYYPLYKVIATLKNILETIYEKREDTDGSKLLDKFSETDEKITALAVGITMLIVIPNDMGIWEHFIVLFLALAVLLYYNRKRIEKKADTAFLKDIDTAEDVTLDEFETMIRRKMEAKSPREEPENTVVSIKIDR